jgi:hypothetical protein
MIRRRYLNKLCDQLLCLLSSEHSRALVWGNENNEKADEEGDDDDDDDTSTDSETTDSDRFFRFQVAKTKDQEESVTVRVGFVVRHSVTRCCVISVMQIPVRCKMNSPLLVNQAPPPDSATDPRALFPVLLHGERVQGFMTATFVPATKIVQPFSYDFQSAEQIRLRL